MNKVQFTILLLDEQDIPFAVYELGEPTEGVTEVKAYLKDDTRPYEAAALLMCAASVGVEAHQRVKLLAMIAEIGARMDFEQLASWKPTQH